MKLLGIIAAVAFLSLTSCANESNASDSTVEEAVTITDSIESPGSNITGLAWGNGNLWAVDASSATVFCLDITAGEVIDSFTCTSIPPSYTATGLAYSEESELIYLGMWDGSYNGYVYSYTPEGSFKGSTSMCGG
jgi:hypothetical protein